MRSEIRSTTSKLSMLMRCLSSNPAEFADRLRTLASAQADKLSPKPDISQCMKSAELLCLLNSRFTTNFIEDREPQSEIEGKVNARLQALSERPFPLFHNAGKNLATLCFLACRAVRPKVVIETGTAYGITAAHILYALAQQEAGQLWSIDLPPLATHGDAFVGSAIPYELRRRWTLIRGTSKRCLPSLISQVGRVDVFIHDSLHTYRNMMREFECVWPALAPGGLLIADDIEGNRAFSDFSKRVNVDLCAMAREETKQSVYGILRKSQVA